MKRRNPMHRQNRSTSAEVYLIILKVRGEKKRVTPNESKFIEKQIEVLKEYYTDVLILSYAVSSTELYIMLGVYSDDLRLSRQGVMGFPYGISAVIEDIKASTAQGLTPFWRKSYTTRLIASRDRFVLYNKLIDSIKERGTIQ